ncbi:lactonase family protein [Gemmata sp. JC673]|uniref:Lactonase family protein n=1 Tax=Gemmata algarum TaxID=2975278 RepID=A0ABU5F0P9_9BACT|nr:beta-propeller fold lactonase family protein [Gemmata algarum]MDY3561153.1 lactonase family protein [Gemmata algarum]
MSWLRTRSETVPAPRPRLGLEALDARDVPAALGSGALAHPGGTAAAVVYTETNNPQDGQNAVLAFARDARTGALTQIGTFATGGTGQLNVPKLVGPDDGDQQVQATADGRFLFAVNQGSDSVTAFRVLDNGGLHRVGTFASGGDQPDSIGIAGNTLYVANRGDAGQGHPGTTAPSVVAFNIGRDGALVAIPNSTVTFPVGTFVTQALVSPDGRFLFVEAATLAGTPGGNTVNTFRIGADGRLTAAPGGPASASANAPVLLGAAAHPTRNIVYTGFASSGQVGVFTYDETGRTNFVGPAEGSGAAPCWCTISADGRVLYVANTATDSVSVFSLADPLHPVQIQELPLGGPRGATAAGRPVTNAFEIALDPTGRFLYAVTQSTDPAFPQGNQLHTLRVARDGTLSEPLAPVIFELKDVPANAHPQGVEVVQLRGGRSNERDHRVYVRSEPFDGDGLGHFEDALKRFRGRFGR